jgi:hypothetical protein
MSRGSRPPDLVSSHSRCYDPSCTWSTCQATTRLTVPLQYASATRALLVRLAYHSLTLKASAVSAVHKLSDKNFVHASLLVKHNRLPFTTPPFISRLYVATLAWQLPHIRSYTYFSHSLDLLPPPVPPPATKGYPKRPASEAVSPSPEVPYGSWADPRIRALRMCDPRQQDDTWAPGSLLVVPYGERRDTINLYIEKVQAHGDSSVPQDSTVLALCSSK